jgi:hypothetical protein
MFESPQIPKDSCNTINSMEELFDFIEASIFYPFFSNSPINYDNELEDLIKRIYINLTTDGKFTNDKIIGSENTTNVNISDDSESPATSTSPQSSDNDDDDGEPFDLEEWMIQDSSSSKIRPPKLYEFLRLLLDKPNYISYASWANKNEGLFTIHKPIQVALLWKKVKARKTNGLMDYDTFARGIRYYYRSGTMIKTHTKHTYCFARV